MATQDLNQENFEKTVTQQGIVVIDWWASWCGPCKAFAPIYEATSEKHKDVTFAKINTEEQQELAGAFQIQAIPTLMVFRDGILLFAQAGALPGSALEELLGKVKSLDMEEVRKEVEKQRQQQQPPQA